MWYVALLTTFGLHNVNYVAQPGSYTSEHSCVEAAAKLPRAAVCRRGIVIVIT